ncbi:hypothetical protein [Nocardia gipuzkoensis]
MTTFAELEAAATRQWERMRLLDTAINEIRAEYHTEEGAISAVADGTGRLVGLVLGAAVTSMTPAAFGAAVAAAAGGAAGCAMAARAALVTEFNAQVNNRPEGEHLAR